MQILSFGHMPSWAGGRQESGLANVIYQLAYHMSQCDGVDMTLAATDFFQPELYRDNLRILGWTKGILIRYILQHPLTSLKLFIRCIHYKVLYPGVFNAVSTYLKMVFFHYSLSMVRPDVVHLHGLLAVLYLGILPKGIISIVTIHGFCGNDHNLNHSESMAKMERLLCNDTRIKRLVFITNGTKKAFLDFYGMIQTPSSIIWNAYDSKSFHYVEHKEYKNKVLMTVASLSQLKGQMRVLQGIALCKQSFSYWCVGAGSKDMERQLRSFADEYGIDFKYFGKKNPSEIRELLSYADYMIMPSSSEGFGLAYIESMACGVPVILPKDLPIVQEKGIIIPRINSLVLKDCTPESISECLFSLEENGFDRRVVSSTMTSFSWQNIALEYVKLIRNL